MTSKMLMKKMKKNIVMRNGSQPRPCDPIVCMITLSRMKSRLASATFCTPGGTSLRLRPAMKKNPNVRITAST